MLEVINVKLYEAGSFTFKKFRSTVNYPPTLPLVNIFLIKIILTSVIFT